MNENAAQNALKPLFIDHLIKTYPNLKKEVLEPLVSENLLSPFTIELPKSVLADAEKAIETLYRLRENPLYRSGFAEEVAVRNLQDPGNKSICMSYDFHVTTDNKLKLIEINTNASFLALGFEMYRMHGRTGPQPDFSMAELRTNIETEVGLQGKAIPTELTVSIIDEKPEQQRLFLEFLVFDQLFKQWGWQSSIQDFRNLRPSESDFVYNRHTDFYLESPDSNALHKAFIDRSTCLSPNPYEYFFLADKQRLIDWFETGALEQWNVTQSDQDVIRAVVPRSLDVILDKKDELWQLRKKFFFKPKRAFGAKQSYRGSSITHKIFDDIVGKEFIAQEFVPPPELTFDGPSGPITFKYDLRCYAYQGRLQMVVARLYQGQVTNLKTLLGGFACVEFI